jgi:methyl-accepting chemotaxis protein
MVWLSCVMAVVGALIAWLIARSLRASLGAEPRMLSSLAHRIAGGDLTARIQIRATDKVSIVAAMTNMQSSLAQVVRDVQGHAQSVAAASAQIAEGNQELSQRTENQASALQTTTATMEQLGAAVNSNADNAKQAHQLANHASEVAGEGGSAVSRFVDTMRAINDSSRRIGDIISVIDGIAFQTNILALNAAVEAARAGEQGRGFAVVASEVRSLAQRSADAAKEIKSLIVESVQQVEQGSHLVENAGKTMEEIVAAIGRVQTVVSEISTACAEQSTGISLAVDAVTDIDHTTQKNAAMVEETAAAASSMSDLAQNLLRTMEGFKV